MRHLASDLTIQQQVLAAPRPDVEFLRTEDSRHGVRPQAGCVDDEPWAHAEARRPELSDLAVAYVRVQHRFVERELGFVSRGELRIPEREANGVDHAFVERLDGAVNLRGDVRGTRERLLAREDPRSHPIFGSCGVDRLEPPDVRHRPCE